MGKGYSIAIPGKAFSTGTNIVAFASGFHSFLLTFTPNMYSLLTPKHDPHMHNNQLYNIHLNVQHN